MEIPSKLALNDIGRWTIGSTYFEESYVNFVLCKLINGLLSNSVFV